MKTPDELREIIANAKEEVGQFDHNTMLSADEKVAAFAKAISVFSQDENGEYRCMYDIFKDLATVWDGICSMERLRSDIEALRRENDNEADS